MANASRYFAGVVASSLCGSAARRVGILARTCEVLVCLVAAMAFLYRLSSAANWIDECADDNYPWPASAAGSEVTPPLSAAAARTTTVAKTPSWPFGDVRSARSGLIGQPWCYRRSMAPKVNQCWECWHNPAHSFAHAACAHVAKVARGASTCRRRIGKCHPGPKGGAQSLLWSVRSARAPCLSSGWHWPNAGATHVCLLRQGDPAWRRPRLLLFQVALAPVRAACRRGSRRGGGIGAAAWHRRRGSEGR